MFKQLTRGFRIAVMVALAAAVSGAATAAETGHLHHVHLNVSDIERTTAFYQKMFGVDVVRYNNNVPAMLVERSFLFMNVMPEGQIVNHQLTGLTHVSWSTRDGRQAAQWLAEQGVSFHTPVEEFRPGSTYMYLYGPDKEVIELVDVQRHHRYNHIHMVAPDAQQTAQWLRELIASPAPLGSALPGMRSLVVDGVNVAIFDIGARFTPRENDGTLRNTDNSHLDHLSFSFRDLGAAYRRIRKSGVQIVRPMQRDPDYGFRHFFVRAPNGVLVELVQARPWPDSAWEK
jgi:catechol 2,3-dioxygenase-like lactoylglutathione lyase family enzyme